MKNKSKEPRYPEPEAVETVADDVQDEVLDAAPAVEDAAAEITPAVEEDPAQALQAEIDEANDKYLRLAADFDNYKKRVAREQIASRVRAQGELITGLLDALDDLGRVAHPDEEREGVKDVLQGVQLVERKLLRHLETAGLSRVGDVDVAFDPNVHEAVTTTPASSEDEDQTVAAVFQIGYAFHGLLLRPARVQVRVWGGEAQD